PSSRGSGGSPSRRAASAAASDGFEVVIVEIEIDGILRGRLFAPQFARRKANRVDVLGLVAPRKGGRLHEGKDAMVALDRAGLAAHVTRQARVRDRMDVERAHGLPGLE